MSERQSKSTDREGLVASYAGARAAVASREATIEALTAENARLREAVVASTEWLESVLSAMDRYNEKNGTYIIGPSLLGAGRQVAANRAALDNRND